MITMDSMNAHLDRECRAGGRVRKVMAVTQRIKLVLMHPHRLYISLCRQWYFQQEPFLVCPTQYALPPRSPT
jgi:hypothetical protein